MHVAFISPTPFFFYYSIFARAEGSWHWHTQKVVEHLILVSVFMRFFSGYILSLSSSN